MVKSTLNKSAVYFLKVRIYSIVTCIWKCCFRYFSAIDFVHKVISTELLLFHRNVLLSVVSNGFRFDGSGYVVLDTVQTGWKPAVTAQVSLGFKTYAENGLLFYAGEGRDFLSIELRNGRLLHQFDLGGGRVQLKAAKKVNDGEWHYVQVNRVNKTGVMYVDQEYCKYDLYTYKCHF